MLLECQESCIINGVNSTKCFKLQKRAQQGVQFRLPLYFMS